MEQLKEKKQLLSAITALLLLVTLLFLGLTAVGIYCYVKGI